MNSWVCYSIFSNTLKCLIFVGTSFPISIDYIINDILISNKISVHEYGFHLLSNLSLCLHIQEICCKVLKILGFIKRISSEFKLDWSLKILFCSFCRLILEYGSAIWDSQLSIVTLMLEKVQRKFLSFAAFILRVQCPPHDYKPVCIALNLFSSTYRRRSANLSLKKLLSNVVDCLSQISFKVSPRTTWSTKVIFDVKHQMGMSGKAGWVPS